MGEEVLAIMFHIIMVHIASNVSQEEVLAISAYYSEHHYHHCQCQHEHEQVDCDFNTTTTKTIPLLAITSLRVIEPTVQKEAISIDLSCCTKG